MTAQKYQGYTFPAILGILLGIIAGLTAFAWVGQVAWNVVAGYFGLAQIPLHVAFSILVLVIILRGLTHEWRLLK